MKRLITMFSTLLIAIGMSGAASAQHRKGQGTGKPATTGIEHAEATANPHGQRGIENAEAKQAEHKKDKDKDKDKHKSKKHKKHHHSH